MELLAEQVVTGHMRGCASLNFDGKNAFNAIRRSHMLPALPRSVPPIAHYATNLEARVALERVLRMQYGQMYYR